VRVLVTGHRGKIGRWVARELERRGHAVVGFDLAEGSDLLDLAAVERAAADTAAVVHLGALAHDKAGRPERIMAVNVLGTWNVLLAAEAAGADRVIHFSSVQALGIAEGERAPDYFPVDDGHPRRAMRPYGLSKRLAEDLCRGFSELTGITTVSLRPVAVWGPERYEHVRALRAGDPSTEWRPFWEYGAFVDVRDVVTAVGAALDLPLPAGHHRALLCALDACGSAPSLELAGRFAARVPIRDPERYQADPHRSLIDCSVAERILGWAPRHTWAEHR
jgi:nucleoside-diphosphate-sugar epimerase